MEEYRMDEHRMHECRKHHLWKYLGVILATLLGSFLAFYFAVNCVMNHFMSRAYAMKQMHKMERYAMCDFQKADREFRSVKKNMFQHKSAVEVIKTPDSYKFIVDLMPFQGNAGAVNIELDKNEITISGESEFSKNNTETFTKMSQTYTLGKGARPDKLSKKKVDNKYIITVPIED